jgi:branched-chain amino acid transport system ATP-binding protein
VSTLLQVKDLSGGHGRVKVLRDFNLDVEAGQVVAVLGPNGAGKTTLLSTLAGILPRMSGEVILDDRPLPSGRPVEANRAGVVLVPDDRALFTPLTVRENLRAACRRGGLQPDDVLDTFPALQSRWNITAGNLSGGEQQMLAVARSLVQAPRVLLIDEMSMGLAPVIVESLLPKVRDIADRSGAVVILVEQHVGLALEIADYAVVLVHGDISLAGPASTLKAQPEVLQTAYIGARAS